MVSVTSNGQAAQGCSLRLRQQRVTPNGDFIIGIDGIHNRISHFFQDLPQSPYSKNTHRIGLHLSKSQAFTVGLESKPQVYTIDGTGYADCVIKADNWVKENFPGCFI